MSAKHEACCIDCSVDSASAELEQLRPCIAQVYATLIMFCLQCLVHMQTRKRMRQKYGLEEEPCNDFHVTAWCAASRR